MSSEAEALPCEGAGRSMQERGCGLLWGEGRVWSNGGEDMGTWWGEGGNLCHCHIRKDPIRVNLTAQAGSREGSDPAGTAL